jgi:hypothetical protein
MAGIGVELSRLPDGILQVRRRRGEPLARRRLSLVWLLVWIGLGVFFTAGLYDRLPGNPEVTAAPGVRELLPPFFALTSLYGLFFQLWSWFGLDEWRVSRNRLEVRRSLFGLSRSRTHTDTDLALWRYAGDYWVLETGSKPQRLVLAELQPAALAALFELGALLARETGWKFRTPERPAEIAAFAPAVTRPAQAPLPATQLPTFSLDPELRRWIEPDLEPGERLLWVGQPEPRRAARQTLGILIFGIPWTLGALCFGQPWSWDHFPSPLFSGLFVLAGVLMCCTPLATYWEAQRTTYGVTDRRVLISVRGYRRKLEFYRPTDLCEAERQELPDGSGDLLFARRQETDSDGHPRTVAVKLIGIPQVREVERLLRQLFPRAAA